MGDLQPPAPERSHQLQQGRRQRLPLRSALIQVDTAPFTRSKGAILLPLRSWDEPGAANEWRGSSAQPKPSPAAWFM